CLLFITLFSGAVFAQGSDISNANPFGIRETIQPFTAPKTSTRIILFGGRDPNLPLEQTFARRFQNHLSQVSAQQTAGLNADLGVRSLGVTLSNLPALIHAYRPQHVIYYLRPADLLFEGALYKKPFGRMWNWMDPRTQIHVGAVLLSRELTRSPVPVDVLLE